MKYLILVIFCLSIVEAKADINLAVIAPQEGDLKNFGEEIISGVKIAVDEINNSGGLKGEKLNLITVDDRCDNRLAVTTAQMMAVNRSQKDKIAVVVGPYCNNEFEKVASIYAKANIFQIIPTSISSHTPLKHHRGLVKMFGYNERQSIDFYKYYSQNFPHKKVAIIYDSEDKEIVNLASSLQQEFKKHGQMKSLKAYNYPSYSSIDELTQDILNDEMALAYIMGSPKRIAKISRSLKSEQNDFVIFTSKYKTQGDYNHIMGDLAEGTYYVGLPSLKDNPNFAETLVQLRLHGLEPEGLAVYGFSAIKLWEELVKTSDSFSYNRLSKTLSEDKVETTWGETMFTNGSPDNALNYGIYLRQNGQYTQVY